MDTFRWGYKVEKGLVSRPLFYPFQACSNKKKILCKVTNTIEGLDECKMTTFDDPLLNRKLLFGHLHFQFGVFRCLDYPQIILKIHHMLGVIFIVNNALPLLYQCTDVINVGPETL